MAPVTDARKRAIDPRKQLPSLFNSTTTDQQVGTLLITEDFANVRHSRRPDDLASRGRIIREAVWRLIEAHNQQYLTRPAKATCAYETCAAAQN